MADAPEQTSSPRPDDGAADDQAPKQHGDGGFSFTDDGCRTEIRIGALLVLMAVFLWLWLGPATSTKLYFVGLPLLLVGVPIQAIQARREGRPGFPTKLGLVLTLGGLLMWPDLTYRVSVTGSLHAQPVAPMLVVAGAWMLLWWPVARLKPASAAPAPAEAAP